MIFWVNGAFGAGKTQTSYELHRRIPNSFVYDPENVGFLSSPERRLPLKAGEGLKPRDKGG